MAEKKAKVKPKTEKKDSSHWTFADLGQAPKAAFDAIGAVLSTVAATVTAIAAYVPVWITTSATLARTMAAGAVIGACIAYFAIPVFWRGKPIDRRQRAAKRFASGSFLFAAFIVALFVTLNPEMAERSSAMDGVRELLMLNPVVLNGSAFIGLMSATFCVVAAIVVLAPGMKAVRGELLADRAKSSQPRQARAPALLPIA